MKVTYHLPINDTPDGGSQTIYQLTIEGSAKRRKREFAKYLKSAFGITNARKVAREMGFKDLT